MRTVRLADLVRQGQLAMVDDIPEAHNRVTLDPVLTDSHGIAAPRVEYTVGANSRR